MHWDNICQLIVSALAVFFLVQAGAAMRGDSLAILVCFFMICGAALAFVDVLADLYSIVESKS